MIVALIAAVSIPSIAGDYYISFATEITIVILLLSSYRIVVLTGEWSFAHVVLQGVGAYTAALCAKKLGAPFPLSLMMGALATASVAAILSVPLLRMKGFYFLMGSFAAAEAIRLLWRKLQFFGGTRGISGIKAPYFDFGWLTVDFGSTANFYYLSVSIVAFCLFVMWRLENSRLGNIWRALAQQDTLAQSVGINTRAYRRIAFIVSAAFAGVAGVLLAYAFGTVSANRFNLTFALYLMIWSIVGGVRTFYGVILGGILLMVFDESLRFAEEYRQGAYGLVLIAIMLFWPQGLERLFEPIAAAISGIKGKDNLGPRN
ncbi:MAG TPA: branched-chain amino acid ABC transporter permease [Aestuariivirga sp.]|nr:branched-chain amino acid ABC transporter permease [Aestuariivirga sp.]